MDVETATVEDDVERKRHKKNPWDSRYVEFCLSGWEPRGAIQAGTQQGTNRHQKQLQLQPTNRRTANATCQRVQDVDSDEDGHDDGSEILAIMAQAHVAASASLQIHARLELIKSMKQALVKQMTEAVRQIGKEPKWAPQSTDTGVAVAVAAGPVQQGFGSGGSDAPGGGSRNEAGGKECAGIDPPDPRLEPRLSACLAVLRGEANLWPGQLVSTAQRQLGSVAAAATITTDGRFPSELVPNSSPWCLEWDWDGDIRSVAAAVVPAAATEQAGACHYLEQLLAGIPLEHFSGQDLMQCDDGEVPDYEQQLYYHRYRLPPRRHAAGVEEEEHEYGARTDIGQEKTGHDIEKYVRRGKNWSGGERDRVQPQLHEALFLTDVQLPYYLMDLTRQRELRKLPQPPPSQPTGLRISLSKQKRQSPEQNQNHQEQEQPQQLQQDPQQQSQQHQNEAPDILRRPPPSFAAIDIEPAGQLQPAAAPAWGMSDKSKVAVQGPRSAYAAGARVSGAWKHFMAGGGHLGAGYGTLRGNEEMEELDAEDIEVVVCMEGDEVPVRVGTEDDDCGRARPTQVSGHNRTASPSRRGLRTVAPLSDDDDTASRDASEDNGQWACGAIAAQAVNSGGGGNDEGPVVSNEPGCGGDGDPCEVVDLLITDVEVWDPVGRDEPLWRPAGGEVPPGCQVARAAAQPATGSTPVKQSADGSAKTASALASATAGAEDVAIGSCWKQLQPQPQPQPHQVVGRKDDVIITEGHAGICDSYGWVHGISRGGAAPSADLHLGYVAKDFTMHRMAPPSPRAAPRVLVPVVSRPLAVPLLAQRSAKHRLAAGHLMAEAPPKPPAGTNRENGGLQSMPTEPEDVPADVAVVMAAPQTAVVVLTEVQRRPVILAMGRRRCRGGSAAFPPDARGAGLTAVAGEGRNAEHGALNDAGADKQGTDDAIESDGGRHDGGITVANKSAFGGLQLRTGTTRTRAADTSGVAAAASQDAAPGASLLPSRGSVPQVLSGRRHLRATSAGSVPGSSIPRSLAAAGGASDQANRQQPHLAEDARSLVDIEILDTVHPGRPGHSEAAAPAAGGSPFMHNGPVDDDGEDAIEVMDMPPTSTSNPGESIVVGGLAAGGSGQGRLRRPVIGRRNAAARCSDGSATGAGEDGDRALLTATRRPSDFVYSNDVRLDKDLMVMGSDGAAVGEFDGGDKGQASDDHIDGNEDEDGDGATAIAKKQQLPAAAAPDAAVGSTTAAAADATAMARALPMLTHRKVVCCDGAGGHVRSAGGEGGGRGKAVTAGGVEPVRQPKYKIRASSSFGMSERQLKAMAPAAMLQSSGWNAKIRCRPVHNPEMLLLPQQLPSMTDRSAGEQSLRELLTAGSSDPRVTGVLSAARRLLGALLPTELMDALPPWPPPPRPPPLPTQKTHPQHQMPGTAVPPASILARPAGPSAGGTWEEDDDDIIYDDAFFQELDRVVESATNAGATGPGGDMARAQVAGLATAPTVVSASDGLPPSAAGGAVPPGVDLGAPNSRTAVGICCSRPAFASRFVPLFNTPMEAHDEDVGEAPGCEGIRGNENRITAGGTGTGAMAVAMACSYRTAAELLAATVHTTHAVGVSAVGQAGSYGASWMGHASPHPPVTVAQPSGTATIPAYTSHNRASTNTYGNGAPAGIPAVAMPGGSSSNSIPAAHIQIQNANYHREEEGKKEGKEEEGDDGEDVAVTICDMDDRAQMMTTPLCSVGAARSGFGGNSHQCHRGPPSSLASMSGQVQLTAPRECQRTHNWAMANNGAYGTVQPYWEAATPAPHHNSEFHRLVMGARDNVLQQCVDSSSALPVSGNLPSPIGFGTGRLAARAAAGNSNGNGYSGSAISDAEHAVEGGKARAGLEGVYPGPGCQIQSSAVAGQIVKPQLVDRLDVSVTSLVMAAAAPIAAAASPQETGAAAEVMTETSADLVNDLETGAASIIYDDGVDYPDALGNCVEDNGGGNRVQLSDRIPCLGETLVGVSSPGCCNLSRHLSPLITTDSKAEDAECDVVVVLPPGSPGPGGCCGIQNPDFGAFVCGDEDFDFDVRDTLPPQRGATSVNLGVDGKLDSNGSHGKDGLGIDRRNTRPESRDVYGTYDDDWGDDGESCSLVFDSDIELYDENVLLRDELAALPGVEVNQICNAVQAAVNEAVERGTVSPAEGAEAVAALEEAAAAAAMAAEGLESSQPDLKQRLHHVVTTAAAATTGAAMLSALPAIASGAKRKREQLWAVYIRELLAARQRSRLNLRTLMAFLANKLTASKAVAASDTRVIGAAGTHRPAVGGETMEPEVCTGATPSGVGYGRGNGVQARKLAAGGADGVAVVEPVGKLHSLSLSLGQLAEAAAGTPGLGCSARIEGRGDEGAPQRGAVSQHRVFLALLNMAHQNNVAWQQEWQQQLEETMGGVAEKMKDPQRVALRGGGAAMSLGQQWMEGVMRLQSWQDGDVQVEVLPA